MEGKEHRAPEAKQARERGSMKYKEAMVAWSRHTDQIKVGPWPQRDGWSKPYRYSVGACFLKVREMTQDKVGGKVFIDFHSIIVRDGVDIAAAHKAFLQIDEYREYISGDILGSDNKYWF